MNITVVPGEPDPDWTRRNVFPEGYVSYFNGLLSNPKCDHDEVALMHWTYVSDRQKALLRLMFLDQRRIHQAPGFLRYPWDLMTPEERREFERH